MGIGGEKEKRKSTIFRGLLFGRVRSLLGRNKKKILKLGDPFLGVKPWVWGGERESEKARNLGGNLW